MTNQKIRTYSELITLPSFKERFEYLKLGGRVGEDTFGFDRYLNQIFYRSEEWKALRNHIIVRDEACDLGVPGYDIEKYIIIHHMNPIRAKDILERSDVLFNPDYLICTTRNTHNAIHYSDESLLVTEPITRQRGDTCPWKVF